ncbi:MAG: class I SAM-dependent methyltransferase [Clostridiales bacterium]|nr:class I SAM-dependent methyltransferase [Clostridiales bacterium]
MNKEKLYWMNYSIDIANSAKDEHLHVGAVLVTEDNNLICSAYAGEYPNLSWFNVLMSKLKECNVDNAYFLFLTVNTLSSKSEFDLNKLIKEIEIKEIYLGIPDPNLSYYLSNDPISIFPNIYRYPDNLQREIIKQNFNYYKKGKQNIKSSPYYSKKRISKLVLEILQESGIVISKEELELNKRADKLTQLIVKKYKLKIKDASNLVNIVISKAFDKKYSIYNYSDDARSLNIDWKNKFLSVYNKLLVSSMENKEILDVGVGSGNEAIALFSKCKKITFVDIAPNGLKKIKRQIPISNIVISRAEDLSTLINDRYDIYISLRTYNSSFFDIEKAISEAYRVLKKDGVIIISIANGFLCPDDKYIIPGLIIPGTEFVDIYRGFDMIKNLSAELSKKGFKNIQFFPTNVELFLSAEAKK